MAEETTSLVIFGASGDLTRRKLIPSLYDLHYKGRLPENLNVVGVSRSPLSDQEFRQSMLQGLKDTGEINPPLSAWDEFARRLRYTPGNVTTPDDFVKLDQQLAEWEGSNGAANRLYYLALAPSLYEAAIVNLGQAGMGNEDNGWRRLVVEKPFGNSLASAQRLNETAHSVFRERQVFRIDHYLGKETVQNLLVFRFGNTIFEPIWNRTYIDHVQITVAEDVPVGDRGDYYDQAGVLRDMFQNHLLQLLTLVAMEPPARFEANALRNEKVKVLDAIRRIPPQEAACHTAHGQYRGYLQEKGVAPDSWTPTFAALRLYVDNWRWQDVPFYLRSGKSLQGKVSEIIIQFKSPPHLMFNVNQSGSIPPNVLAICIQPDEGFHMEFQSKVPDAGLEMRPVDMEFHYQGSFGDQPLPDAYERLLLDALHGDASLFTRSDEIEAAWEIMDPIIEGLSSAESIPPWDYEPGSWGPEQADRFLSYDGRQWLRGCAEH